MAKKPFGERSLEGKTAIVVAGAVGLGLVATAQRDLLRRPEDQVRGSKNVWRLLSLNALGAGAYLRFGRRG